MTLGLDCSAPYETGKVTPNQLFCFFIAGSDV